MVSTGVRAGENQIVIACRTGVPLMARKLVHRPARPAAMASGAERWLLGVVNSPKSKLRRTRITLGCSSRRPTGRSAQLALAHAAHRGGQVEQPVQRAEVTVRDRATSMASSSSMERPQLVQAVG